MLIVAAKPATEGALCRHCSSSNPPHKYVCDCGHHHNDHNSSGGCIAKLGEVMCSCEGYSQKTQRLPGSVLAKRMTKKEKLIAEREALEAAELGDSDDDDIEIEGDGHPTEDASSTKGSIQ